jgi:hypothetical protein
MASIFMLGSSRGFFYDANLAGPER